MFQRGDKLGPYVLKDKLGNGSFGVVWLAERTTAITTTLVALKIAFDETVELDAIKGEANLWVAASGHPNVVPLIEADILEGRLIIVSEYAKDGTLADWLLRRPHKDRELATSVRIISGLLDGLEHLHNLGIVHRDLKPANILFQGEIPRLADFGISRALNEHGSTKNSAGTPAYMAPEAFDGARTIQTDIWSMGVVIYQILAGNLPFPTGDFGRMVKGIFFDDPLPTDSSVPIGLHTIISRALRKSPEDRYSSVGEIKEDLNSRLVKWHLLIEPDENRRNEIDPLDLSDREIGEIKTGPRPHHYYFAHRFMRERALEHPQILLTHLQSEPRSRLRRLASYWHSAQPPGTPYVPADGLDCVDVNISPDHLLFVVRLPRAVRMAEAIFLGIVVPRPIGGDEDDSISRCRYFTLELSFDDATQSVCTAFCEWVGESHRNYVAKSNATVEGFAATIRSSIGLSG